LISFFDNKTKLLYKNNKSEFLDLYNNLVLLSKKLIN